MKLAECVANDLTDTRTFYVKRPCDTLHGPILEVIGAENAEIAAPDAGSLPEFGQVVNRVDVESGDERVLIGYGNIFTFQVR